MDIGKEIILRLDMESTTTKTGKKVMCLNLMPIKTRMFLWNYYLTGT